ncbi:MAG: EAL domain-containing protein [Treponema sp.]|nr:EAL domain-containing protein [Treponema sp.]
MKRLSKRILTFLCYAILSQSFFSEASFADDGNTAPENLTVGVPVDRCPVFYQDSDTKEIAGIGVELMRLAAEYSGYSVTFKAIEEATLKDALDNTSYDIVMPFGSAIPSTSGRATIISENLMQTPFALVTENKRNLTSLNKLRVGMIRSLGGAAETVREIFPDSEITLYNTMSENVKALRSEKVDALLHNSYVWSYTLQKPSYAKLEVNPLSLFSMDFRAGTQDSPKGRAIIERLNNGIASITDIQRQAAILNYTSRRLYKYDLFDYLYEYGLLLVLGTLLIISIIIIFILKQRTLRIEEEKRMIQLIDHDPLTGALNLNGFKKRVTELLQTYPDTHYLLVYINVRNFKFINDSLGMAAGDDFLRFLIGKFQENLSEKEVVCRLANDHIGVLRLADKSGKGETSDHALINTARNYFINRGKENRIQICSGIYVLEPKDYQEIDISHMLDFARVAEKRVRETRTEGYEFYNPEQWEKGKHITDILNHLPSSIQAGDIKVWYQPQVDYETKKITGAEALCRWNHTKLGWLRPDDFISTLEETGLIYDLDRFVWEQVCRDLQKWNSEGFHRTVSVNVSRCDIREDSDLPLHFLELTKKYAVHPSQIHIEITETAFVENPDLLIRTTTRLQEYGFQVEMDDFGSGYSSLNMLKEVPLNRIKLDLHFLTNAGDSKKGLTVVTYVIKMIRALGMTMISEGVENITQAEFLKSKGCSEMQGFFFYKPMSREDFEKLMNKQQ